MVVATSVITAWIYVATRSVLLPRLPRRRRRRLQLDRGRRHHHEAFWAAVVLEVLAACAIAWRYGRQLHSSGPLSRTDAPAML